MLAAYACLSEQWNCRNITYRYTSDADQVNCRNVTYGCTSDAAMEPERSGGIVTDYGTAAGNNKKTGERSRYSVKNTRAQ